MSGIVATSQKCPSCGKKFPTSKGDFPIICETCRTQPTKFVIKLYWKKKNYSIFRDRKGRTVHHWNHAVNLLGNIRSEIDAGGFFPETYKKQSSTRFSDFWKDFESDYKVGSATRSKINTIGKHHLDIFMPLQMRDIRAIHLNKWWKKMKKKELSPKYMNDVHQWLKRFMKEAYELDIITKVPKFPNTLKVPKKSIEWLQEEEQLEILELVPKHDVDIYDFMFLTGVRVSEAIALRRSDIDFKKGRTIIQHTVKKDRHTIGLTKSQNVRVIPHTEEIEECLRRAVKVTGLNDQVFINQWGRIYTQDYLRDRFFKALDAAGLKRIPLKNGTRHSFGMRMVSRGVDIWTTSKAMGHSDIKMTQNYADILASQLKDAYKKNSRSNAAILDFKKDPSI